MAPCPHTVLLSLARAAKCNRHGGGIDESLARERKIKRRKRNFSLDLENFIASISLSTNQPFFKNCYLKNILCRFFPISVKRIWHFATLSLAFREAPPPKKKEEKKRKKTKKFFLGNFPKSVYPPQGFCEIWENKRWNSGRKGQFSEWFF